MGYLVYTYLIGCLIFPDTEEWKEEIVLKNRIHTCLLPSLSFRTGKVILLNDKQPCVIVSIHHAGGGKHGIRKICFQGRHTLNNNKMISQVVKVDQIMMDILIRDMLDYRVLFIQENKSLIVVLPESKSHSTDHTFIVSLLKTDLEIKELIWTKFNQLKDNQHLLLRFFIHSKRGHVVFVKMRVQSFAGEGG